jgi:hypothetical protein
LAFGVWDSAFNARGRVDFRDVSNQGHLIRVLNTAFFRGGHSGVFAKRRPPNADRRTPGPNP